MSGEETLPNMFTAYAIKAILAPSRDTPPGKSFSSDGRSPDSWIDAFPSLPEALLQWRIGAAIHLQLRGQSRIWRL